jgi:hypothetical protein
MNTRDVHAHAFPKPIHVKSAFVIGLATAGLLLILIFMATFVCAPRRHKETSVMVQSKGKADVEASVEVFGGPHMVSTHAQRGDEAKKVQDEVERL